MKKIILTAAACFIAGATGMKYKTFLLSVISGAVPMVILYTVAGTAIMASVPVCIAVAAGILALVAVAVFVLRKWSSATEQEAA
ncbi:hypothetical protein [Ectobacillus ponti]|uniref:Uncharacterized protein n=1 Tax=Ectobacillus ponti TaxID=2961894 RepID=A0AA41X9B9_9BACI|nr:hypothetical protein [Ectobacillus ponti]MCP8969260.1 hypothetical protein [Ectobacillus ponti]